MKNLFEIKMHQGNVGAFSMKVFRFVLMSLHFQNVRCIGIVSLGNDAIAESGYF